MALKYENVVCNSRELINSAATLEGRGSIVLLRNTSIPQEDGYFTVTQSAEHCVSMYTIVTDVSYHF